MYHSFLSLSIVNKTPCGMKRHHESAKPPSCQTTKISFPFFREATVVEIASLTRVSHETVTFYIEQYTTLSLFTTSKSHTTLITILSRTLGSFGMPFSKLKDSVEQRT